MPRTSPPSNTGRPPSPSLTMEYFRTALGLYPAELEPAMSEPPHHTTISPSHERCPLAHVDEPGLWCAYRPGGFTAAARVTALRKHMTDHALHWHLPSSGRPYHCPINGCAYDRPHTIPATHGCPPTRDDLVEHMMRHITLDETPYPSCPLCARELRKNFGTTDLLTHYAEGTCLVLRQMASDKGLHDLADRLDTPYARWCAHY
ncbi:hypothetical protein BD626DRAFT_479336 [Schizophyllum amplum]|uniref:Uncharacterized protein n=1 Tax=Schizophyllum amplum TaxID=97359 RepID=A0A550CS66_9AGAR|nr:hypothetical protein BD626DRAFT_479336 [Auriculariopsis ampla]